MKPLRVAELAWPDNSMPPVGYGPIQLVAARVANGLYDKGIDVTSFTTADSKVKGKIMPITDHPTRTDPTIPDPNLYHSVTIAEFMRHKDDFDIVHSHIGHAIITLIDSIKVPVVITLHGAYDNGHTPKVYGKYAKKAHFVAISEAQKSTMPNVNYAGTVYHGVDVDEYYFKDHIENYMVYVGRTSPGKGIGEAIQIAEKMKIKLKIAAHRDLTDAGKKYFKDHIKPFLGNPYIEFLDEQSQESVKELISNAKLFLYPIDFFEAFGLVVAEACASGTPVLTYKSGAMPELINNGINGFIFEKGDEQGITKKIQQIYSMSQNEYNRLRKSTKEYISNNFSIDRMVNGYLDIFNKLANK